MLPSCTFFGTRQGYTSGEYVDELRSPMAGRTLPCFEETAPRPNEPNLLRAFAAGATLPACLNDQASPSRHRRSELPRLPRTRTSSPPACLASSWRRLTRTPPHPRRTRRPSHSASSAAPRAAPLARRSCRRRSGRRSRRRRPRRDGSGRRIRNNILEYLVLKNEARVAYRVVLCPNGQPLASE